MELSSAMFHYTHDEPGRPIDDIIVRITHFEYLVNGHQAVAHYLLFPGYPLEASAGLSRPAGR